MSSSARAAFLAFSLLPALVAAEGRRGVVPRDLLALETLSALEVSPDGATLVYGIERADAAQDAYTHDLFLMPSGGGPARRIGEGKTDDTSPRFSADGRQPGLALRRRRRSADRGGAGGREGREARDLAWPRASSTSTGRPTGRTFVFTRTDPSPASAGGPWVITRKLIQRDGEGFLDERRTHLWLVPASGGEPRRITSGPYDDSEPRFSPDGRLIAFVSNRTEDPDTNDDTDIFVVAPDGSGLRRVASTPGPDDWPRWSHASDRIAFRGAYRANDWFQTRPLMVAPVAGGPVLDLTRDLDTWMAYDIANTYAVLGGDLVARRPVPLQDLRAPRRQLPGPDPQRRLGPRARAAGRGSGDRPGSAHAGGRPPVLRARATPRTCTRSTPCPWPR